MKNNHSVNLIPAIAAATKTTFVALTLLFVGACTSLMPKNNVTQVADMTSPTELNQWTARGKMMVAANGEKVSGYFYWQQNGNDLAFSLNTLIGINMFELTINNNVAKLQVDGKTYQDKSAEHLIFRLTGLDIPVSQLRWWVLGQVNPNKNSEANPFKTHKKNNANSAVTFDKVQQRQVSYKGKTWSVKYASWQKVMQFELPKSVSVTTDQNRIKLSITDWALQG